jgi:molecular chaperone GrpE (heat shock protein)
MKADDFAFAINDILKLRKKMERIFENQDNTNNDVFDGINEYSNELLEILNNYNINIDEYVM